MYRAEISMTIFKIIGIWPPKCSQGMYYVFTIIVANLMLTFAISNALFLFRGNYDKEIFSESFFYVLAISIACAKMIIIFKKQSKMTEITELLLNDQFVPQDKKEIFIQNKFDRIARKGTSIFIGIVSSAVILRIILPLVKGAEISLPFNVWVPYNLENRLSFWLTFILQSVGTMIAGQAPVAVDTFAVVMMLQLCAQMEILVHRIEIFPEVYPKSIFLGNWIQHHNSLYHFSNKLNDVFSLIFFIQLLATAVEVCLSVSLLATFSVTSMKFWSMMFSLSGVLFQASIYCWHGHMVAEKSKEVGSAVFYTDWILLSKKSRTCMIQIIKRSNVPIKLAAGPVFPLSIDTFNGILRLSYTIYNYLKRPTLSDK